MDPKLLEEVVRLVVLELAGGQNVSTMRQNIAPGSSSDAPEGLCRPRSSPRTPPFSPRELAAIKAATPARVAQGRTGVRFTTDKSINIRAEHAIALDAVHSTVPGGFPGSLGCLALASRAKTHEEFLLYPDQGRRLDDASRARLQAEGTHGADIQLIAGDGLSAWAILANGPLLVPALQQELTAAGYSVGRPLFVTRARVGVQDEIGVLLKAKATIILVGERPGLGTGDSLSIYTAFSPRLGQDNAEKDCISNIRPLGIPPLEAAKECAVLLKRTFAAGGGGVHLTKSGL
jgi:ethanolamine ammonia-lyase small subunit